MADQDPSGPPRCPACGAPVPPGVPPALCPGCGAPPRPVAAAAARGTRGGWLLAASWGYAVAVLAALVLVRWVGAAWWGGFVLLFAPRWLFLVPVGLLAAASAARRCPGHWPLQGAIGLVVAGPLMGLSVPRQRWGAARPAGERVRVVTYNLGTAPLRVDALLRWAERAGVDVFCFQEGNRDDPTRRALRAGGWHLSRFGAVASRLPIVGEGAEYPLRWEPGWRWTSVVERVRLRAPSGDEFAVASVHLPTLRPGFLDLYHERDAASLRRHAAWWAAEAARAFASVTAADDLPLVVAGDFNMPADDATMAALRTRFRFAFEEAGWGYGYTRPTQYPWVRIDHVLAGPEWDVRACRVGPDFGSDHLPILAELVLPPPPPADPPP